MLSRLTAFFSAPQLADPTEQRRAQLLNFLLNLHLSICAGLLVIYPVRALVTTPELPEEQIAALATVLPVLGLRWLLRHGHTRLSATLFSSFIALLVPVAAWLANASMATASQTMFQILALVMAALLLGRGGVFVFLALTLGLNALLLTAEMQGWYPVDLVRNLPGVFLNQVVAFSAIASLLWLANRLIDQAFDRLSQENAERRRAEEQLRDLNAELERRVVARTAELQQAKEAAEAARHEVERLYAEQVAVAEKLRSLDQLKSQFLASMSHELRTPLNAILNFSRFVLIGMHGPVNDQQKESLNKVVDAGKHLLALINDVLDIAKIEAGSLNLLVERDVSLVDELNTVAALGDSLLMDKPVRLVRDYPPDLPPMLADRRRIRQIVLNLVSNACKFTAHGTITLSARAQPNQTIHIVVQDTGPGIPLGERTFIFEAFRQAKAGISQGGGTGLGLPIARHLAEAHGGRLWLEDQPGVGATFVVELPIYTPALEKSLVPA